MYIGDSYLAKCLSIITKCWSFPFKKRQIQQQQQHDAGTNESITVIHHSHPKTNSHYTCTKYDMFTTLLQPQTPCNFWPELHVLEILRDYLICHGNLIKCGMEFWNDALWDTLQSQHIIAMLERLQCSCVWIRAGGYVRFSNRYESFNRKPLYSIYSFHGIFYREVLNWVSLNNYHENIIRIV